MRGGGREHARVLGARSFNISGSLPAPPPPPPGFSDTQSIARVADSHEFIETATNVYSKSLVLFPCE